MSWIGVLIVVAVVGSVVGGIDWYRHGL